VAVVGEPGHVCHPELQCRVSAHHAAALVRLSEHEIVDVADVYARSFAGRTYGDRGEVEDVEVNE
jgi:hypothetical protein